MGSLRSKLDHLEQLSNAGECAACRSDNPNQPFNVVTNFDKPDTSEPDRCEACGRLLTVVVRWELVDESPRTA